MAPTRARGETIWDGSFRDVGKLVAACAIALCFGGGRAAGVCADPITTPTPLHVDCDANPAHTGGDPKCSDTVQNGDGSSENPWISMRAAAKCVGNNQRIVVQDGPCRETQITINKSDIHFVPSGSDPIEITQPPNTVGDAFIVSPPAQRVKIENFHIVSTVGGSAFNQGVTITGSTGQVQDIILEKVQVKSSTSGAAFNINTAGQNICFKETLAEGAGTTNNRQNGYGVNVPAGRTLTGLSFESARAERNKDDGFSISHSTGVVDVEFHECAASNNEGDGFDISATQSALFLNVTSTGNGRMESGGPGRGITMTQGTPVQIENAHIRGNKRAGIVLGERAPAILLANTVVGNDVAVTQQNRRNQIVSRGDLVLYNSIAAGEGSRDVYVDGGTARCGYNMVNRLSCAAKVSYS